MLKTVTPTLTRYEWVKSFLKGCIAHQGEIAAIKAAHKRALACAAAA